jgi:hypothetical protein
MLKMLVAALLTIGTAQAAEGELHGFRELTFGMTKADAAAKLNEQGTSFTEIERAIFISEGTHEDDSHINLRFWDGTLDFVEVQTNFNIHDDCYKRKYKFSQLIDRNFLTKYGPPDYHMNEEDSNFASKKITWLWRFENHASIIAEYRSRLALNAPNRLACFSFIYYIPKIVSEDW